MPYSNNAQIQSLEISLPLSRGAYQNNGASPWYVNNAVLGTPGTTMKINFDTGSQFSWLTSNQCNTTACKHYSSGSFRTRFPIPIFENKTFEWVDKNPASFDFGHWGNMEMNTAKDIFEIAGKVEDLIINPLNLVTHYKSNQFKESNWDGSFGVPTGFDKQEGFYFHFVEQLINQGLLAPSNAEISFFYDPTNPINSSIFIGTMTDRYLKQIVDIESETILTYSKHPIEGLGYIWTTKLDSMFVGNDEINFDSEHGGEQSYFCLDTGSSQLKGDARAMTDTYHLMMNAINANTELPNLTFKLPDGTKLILEGEDCLSTIEDGSFKNKSIIDIAPLPYLPQLALMGSKMLDHIFTRYIYNVTDNGKGGYSLFSKEMRIYNKLEGPCIIQKV